VRAAPFNKRVRFDRDCTYLFVHECLLGWRKCRHSLNGALGTPDARKKCRRATSVPLRRQKQRYGTRRPDTACTADQDFRAKALIQRPTEGRLQAGGRGFEPRSAHQGASRFVDVRSGISPLRSRGSSRGDRAHAAARRAGIAGTSDRPLLGPGWTAARRNPLSDWVLGGCRRLLHLDRQVRTSRS